MISLVTKGFIIILVLKVLLCKSLRLDYSSFGANPSNKSILISMSSGFIVVVFKTKQEKVFN